MEAEIEKQFKKAKNDYADLEEHAPKLPVTGGLIRKCRIAMDLDWTCPFSSDGYDAYDLPKLDELKQANNGIMPRLLRNGMLIRLHKNPPRSQQNYPGVWRIASIKEQQREIPPRPHPAFLHHLSKRRYLGWHEQISGTSPEMWP